MAIVEMRRHRMWAEVETGGYNDEEGIWHAGEKEWAGGWECDIVPTTKSTAVIYDGGEARHYTFICYMSPLSNCEIDKGTKVRLCREGHEYVLRVITTRAYKNQLKVYVG